MHSGAINVHKGTTPPRVGPRLAVDPRAPLSGVKSHMRNTIKQAGSKGRLILKITGCCPEIECLFRPLKARVLWYTKWQSFCGTPGARQNIQSAILAVNGESASFCCSYRLVAMSDPTKGRYYCLNVTTRLHGSQSMIPNTAHFHPFPKRAGILGHSARHAAGFPKQTMDVAFERSQT
jgi:hypothetical protein